jgi:DNA-binding PadR family transcriptional regulator
MKLTDRQIEGLAALDSWRKGMQIPTTSLRHDGVSLAVLRSLEEHGLVDGERASNGIFWRITDAGREALKVSP